MKKGYKRVMADGKKIYFNQITKEVIWCKSKVNALQYFKADGKRLGYKITSHEILNAEEILEIFGVVCGRLGQTEIKTVLDLDGKCKLKGRQTERRTKKKQTEIKIKGLKAIAKGV